MARQAFDVVRSNVGFGKFAYDYLFYSLNSASLQNIKVELNE